MKINTLQQMTNDILLRLWVTNNQVAVVPVEYNTIADAAGVYIDFRPTLDNVTAIGVIHVQPSYLDYFSHSEWRFILAHECSHIFHNHVVDTLFWKLLEGILKGPNNQNKVIVDLAKVLLTIFSSEPLPPDALTLSKWLMQPH